MQNWIEAVRGVYFRASVRPLWRSGMLEVGEWDRPVPKVEPWQQSRRMLAARNPSALKRRWHESTELDRFSFGLEISVFGYCARVTSTLQTSAVIGLS